VSGVEDRVRDALEALGSPYEMLPCDPAYADTAVFCERYGVDPAETGNTILVSSKKEPRQHAVCVVLATTKLDVNHAVADLMGIKRLSFASAEETAAITGMEIGGVTPFGLPPELPLYLDARVTAAATVLLGGGGRSTKVRLPPAGLLKLPNVRVVEGLAIPR
jgi:prolyl-tRNA editing enzyme YbaK/EbsC (Cys-tRNA(Pro) deacylase)